MLCEGDLKLSHLKHGGETTVLGQLVLVVPSPVGPGWDGCNGWMILENSFLKIYISFVLFNVVEPGNSTSVCNGVVELAAEQPSWKLVHLHLQLFHLVSILN